MVEAMKHNALFALATVLSKFGKTVARKRSIAYIYEGNAPEELFK
ncbi:cyclic lactone autoinducer peptide [Sinorhizobium medicae]|nr:cyclic lactone autoinducer peptide [Sinorhizobium medicae]